MKKSRQIISLLLSVLMITALFTAVPFTANAAIASYGLYLGETEVTSENAGDILGDGKASYDNSTKTLTLDNPVIPGKATDAYGYTAKIYSRMDELTIEGSYLMTASEAKYAVDAKQVIFDGNFSLYGSESGVYAYGIKFNGGRAYCWGKTGQGVQTTGVLGVYDGIQRVEFTSKFSSAVYYGKEFYKGYEVNVTTPANYSYGTHCILDGNNGNADATTVVLENPANGPKSGTTGDCTWEFDPGTGIMTISGNGAMANYDWNNETKSTNAPWWDFRDKIKSVVIGDGVTAVGEEAFEKCANLTSLSLGKSVKEIKYDSFNGCAITSLEIPDSVETIGDSAFTHNSTLNNVSFGKNVKDIGGYAFYQDGGLTEVVLPDGVESVGYLAFGANNDLKKVTIPASVTYIREYAFGYITLVEKIEGFTIYGQPDTAAQTYAEENGFTFVAFQTYDLWLGTTQVTSLNCDDILNDGGKAKFDPSTNTLTLNNPNISDYYTDSFNYTNVIYTQSGIENLTITGKCELESYTADYGVCNDGGGITLNGDFVLSGTNCAVGANGDVTISGGDIYLYSDLYSCVACDTFTMTNDVKKLTMNSNCGAVEATSINLGSELAITKPDGVYIEYGENFDEYRIYDKNGEYAKEVVIEKSAAPARKIGDVDGNGSINISDVTAIQRHIAELDVLTGDALIAADTNGDGVVDITDATHLQKYLAEYDVVLGKQ